ncbi:unnamed protein product [Clavelina lepadiformis]|uniref:Uncharacterized protein n=1 Tax=Clavelina lepadiformis TaxID=159417 RepID=A0ABP0FW26_CLALP
MIVSSPSPFCGSSPSYGDLYSPESLPTFKFASIALKAQLAVRPQPRYNSPSVGLV